jgi:hypothetical protein
MYGSSIVNLAPIQQKDLIERYGWGRDIDILNLTELSKDSGRIYFMLTADPRQYEGLDYLDPIFNGLKPPVGLNLARQLFSDN